MEINKEQLQKALEIVKPGLANKEMVVQSTSFAFLNGRVITYNDEISISHPVKGLEIEGAIKAEELYKLLSKVKTEKIDVTITDNEIKLSSGRTKVGMTLQSEIKLPLDDSIAHVGEWKEIPEGFSKFVKLAVGACSKIISEYKFTCVHITKHGIIEASDGYKITYCQLKEEMPIKTFLLPASSAVEVVRIDPTQISEGHGWVHFKNAAGTILSCRILEEEYGNTSAFLKSDGERITFPLSLRATLDRAEIFAKRDAALAESITVDINKGKLTVKSKSDSGWFEETLNMEYDREAISFDITPYLMKGILEETQGCQVDSSKLKFEGAGWVHVVTLRHRK